MYRVFSVSVAVLIRGGVALALGSVIACSSTASPQGTDDVAIGEDTFRNVCAKCHGAEGRGGVPLTPDGPKPRDLTDAAWQATRSDADLAAVIRDGKPPMPAFASLLSPQQIQALIGKIRRLGKEEAR
jgi:mono/diheme cytochrome c family protein